MRLQMTQIAGPFLTRAKLAQDAFSQVVAAHASEACICLDFDGVVQMTPSFSDTLFFNLAARYADEEFRKRISIANASEHIQRMIDRSLARKAAGKELTAYEPEPA